MPSSAQQSVATIDQFLQAVGHMKAADGFTPLSEPGSIGGETEHPVKKVDDRLEKAKEGFRSSENSKDVKEDQGKPSVENAAEAKAGVDRRAGNVFNVAGQFAFGQQKRADGVVSQGGSAEDDHMNIGLRAAPTGEDPSNETDSAKAGKEDKRQGNMGGTDHPASTENDKIDGHKWAADLSLEKLAAAMKDVGDNLCAQIAWVSQQQGNFKTAQAAQQYSGQQYQRGDIDPYLAQQLGWEMAGLVNGTFDKQAADSLVVGTLEQIVKTASDDADRFIHFMDHFIKEAEDEVLPEMGNGGGMPPDAGSPPPGGGGEEEAMLAALGGGVDAGGGGHPLGGEGGGGEVDDAEAMQLAQILEQLGVSPEELEQAMREEAAGNGGDLPPGDGSEGGGMEVQASDRSGRGRQKQAETDKHAQARQYISEIVQRSRARRAG